MGEKLSTSLRRPWLRCMLSLASGCSQSLGAHSATPPIDTPAIAADAGVVHVHQDAGTSPQPSADSGRDAGPTGAPTASVDAAPRPGCGLSAAAFCETFDEPAATRGRAGELDVRRWSGARLAPQLPSQNGVAIGVGPGPLPADCRSDLPSSVLPDQDALVCKPSSYIASSHLLVVAAAQNYGQNSYRIRQPFDFAGRTGHVVFDAEASVTRLLGWISVEITADPINAPSFAFGGVTNDEGSLIPPNAVELQFQNACEGYAKESSVSLRSIAIYRDYQLEQLSAQTPTCVRTQPGKLNHFELTISQRRIEVRATNYSDDGKSFGTPVLIYDADVNLPFSRGYVHITTHNHASLKYSDQKVEAWNARWDNVGFDGPVLKDTREYEIADSLIPGRDAANRSGPVVSVGYRIPDRADPPLSLAFRDVDPAGMKWAVLSLSTWYLGQGGEPAKYGLRYRWNAGPWHDRQLSAGELGRLTSADAQGQLGQLIEVSPAELKDGDNTLELGAVNVPQNYPPVAANIDLVLGSD